MQRSSTSPGKQPDATMIRISASSQAPQSSDAEAATTCLVRTTDHLKTFVSTFCDRQATDMATMIKTSMDLFTYCIPAREAILVFYGELFLEYSTYYWINRNRSTSSLPSQNPNLSSDERAQSNKGRLDYVGELTRRFYQFAKLKLADEREDRNSDTTSSQMPSPTKSIPTSVITGPESPSGSSQACASPTCKSIVPITGPRVIPVSRRTSSCNSTNEIYDQTPMSPSTQDPTSLAEVAEPDDETDIDADEGVVDILSDLQALIGEIKNCLMSLVIKHTRNNDLGDQYDVQKLSRKCSNRLKAVLTGWSIDLLVQLNSKHSQTCHQIATELNRTAPTNLLTRQIDLWMANPVTKLVVELLLESQSDMNVVFGRMMSCTQNCDWLLAYLLLEMSKRPNCDQEFAKSMEFLIGSQSNINSLTYILAYLSDNNPKSMTNFPKSNIPFIISLCQSSISLLNVLALEIPDDISPTFLNNLAKEIYNKVHSTGHSNCIESIAHCVIAAPNTYKLFLLAFDVILNDETSQEVKSGAQVIIDSILMRIHERAIQGLVPHKNLMPNPHLHLIDGLLKQINNEPARLIQKSSCSKYIAKKANAIFYRMSLIFGHTFASKVISHYLNLPERDFWPLLRPMMNRFINHFGDDGSILISQTLSADPSLRTKVYWNNINTLVTKCPKLKLDLDLISQLMSDKLCAAIFDLKSIAQLVKLCCSSLERVEQFRIRIGTKHRLCKALTTCYFLLLEDEKHDFPEILSYIRISLTCMSLLKQSPVSSHILCRALLEQSLVYGRLFNKNFNPNIISECLDSNEWNRTEGSIKLTKENLKVSLGHRFRRLPNYNRVVTEDNTAKALNSNNNCPSENGAPGGDVPDRQSINSYLLIEAFKSSINNIEAFANLFVEFHCPVTFDKHLWPNDEALRVINEKNLAILRKFEQIPPFWDLFEFIGQSKCLKNCLVLVKALLSAHLALWASATTESCTDKMESTSRLIPPLAQSGLIPRAFRFTVDVFPHLSANEVFSVLSDIWQYVKDTNMALNESDLSPQEECARSKVYLNRLRLFMCQHMPGPTYVKIFKDFYVKGDVVFEAKRP